MKICANLSLLFTELPLVDRIVAASAAGFDGVEIQFPYEVPAIRLKEALEAAGMPLRVINLPAADLMTGGDGLAAVPARQAEFDQALETALSYAAMVRPALVNVLPGRLAEGVEREHALQTLAANLRKTADAFALLGIGVVCEAVNTTDMPGFLINGSAHLQALLERVDHANCSAQYDLYHMAMQGEDISTGIHRLKGRIGHVQFADCPGRGEPGSGKLDFMAAFKTLRSSGYGGWIGAEYKPGAQGTQASLSWLREWRAQLEHA
ncbi:hydroxypyruvate isomerase family protein [Pseudomonas sp. RL_15y_Pfl2_60]|uniref:hydroxypyruvate isomerase family protein n=1 Tax=Pseudomonas sp. RL_15y_Pfl2_60 TaxID=3088709 RepID=UPI0030DD15F0